MSRTKTFAERELDILSKSNKDPENRPIIEQFRDEILSLVDKFGNSGQSGGSAPYTASAISQAVEKLCLQKPICPITGIEDEWMDVADSGDGSRSKNNIVYQNMRCGALFKNGDGKVWYLDAIVWKDEKGLTWSGSAQLPNGEKVFTRQFIRKFPFEPKTFYVDIEVKKDDWEFYVKDEKQLEEVFSYYKSPWSRNILIEKV